MDTLMSLTDSLSVILNIFTVILCGGVAVMIYRMRGDFIRRFGNASPDRKKDAQYRYIALLVAPLLMAGISLVFLLRKFLSGSPADCLVTLSGYALPVVVLLFAFHSGLTMFPDEEEEQGRENGKSWKF